MSLNIKGFIMAFLVLGAGYAEASEIYSDDDYFVISKMTVKEVDQQDFPQTERLKEIYTKSFDQVYPGDPIGQAGQILYVARDLVALGLEVYQLVIKGKPSNTTEYAPISVIPRVNGEAVEILDTERWSAPVKRTYQIAFENKFGAEVVKFRYSVLYSYRGSFEGKGAYLTGVQVVPESVRTLFGFDFTASMKLGGIVNRGTRKNPIAGATILLEYTVSSVFVAINKVDSFFITGLGQFKKL